MKKNEKDGTAEKRLGVAKRASEPYMDREISQHEKTNLYPVKQGGENKFQKGVCFLLSRSNR